MNIQSGGGGGDMLPFETPLHVTRHIVNAMLSGNHSLQPP